MQNKPRFTREQRYQMVLFGILVISSVLSVSLFVARAAPSKNGPFTSLVLNLVLAWVPFGFAWIVYKFIHCPRILIRVLVSVCAVLWLIFFPNSLYILTDFQHIAIRDTDTPIWYDVIMLLWFSWTGLLLGLTSLYFMQKVVTRWLGKIFSWVFVVGATILGSLGVYIGRFIELNSWDVIINPFSILGSFREHFLYPPYHQVQFMTFFFLFALFFLFVFVTLFILGQLMNEQGHQG
jgi:uncharacterized membrane protein